MSLTNKEKRTLDDLGTELKECLINIVDSIPNNYQSIREMSVFLEFNKSNTQRILKAVHDKKGGRYVICLVPGYTALKEFLLKTKPYIDDNHYQSANQSFELFNTTIRQNYQSHAKLKRLLTEDNQPINVSTSNFEKRKAFYFSAKNLLGASVERLFSGHIIQENKHNSQFLHEIVMISKKGIERNKNSAPCVLHYTHPHPNNFIKPNLINAHTYVCNTEFTIGIVDEHSTENLIDSYDSFSPTNLGLVFGDVNNQNPFDATFLFSNPDEIRNPLEEKSQCSSTFTSIKSPTKKLSMVVFLDRKIDMRSSVNIGCYHSSQMVENKELRDSDEWTDHLPSIPELKIIDFNSVARNPHVDDEVNTLSDYMFNYAQLDKKDFVCYLVEVEYPIWSSTYRIYFDHC